LIVEFAGLPGSGKTTLSRTVKEELLSRKNYLDGISIDEPSAIIAEQKSLRRIIVKLGYALLGFFIHPLLSFHFLLVILYSHQNSIKNFLKNHFNGIYLIGLYSRYRNSRQIVLFDQGGLQALWSVFFSSTLGFEEKQKLITRMPGFLMAEYIVFLDCGIDLIFSRLKKREGKQSRMEEKTFSDETVRQIKDDLELIQHESIRRNRDSHTKKILTLDNSNETFLIDNSILIAEKIIEAL